MRNATLAILSLLALPALALDPRLAGVNDWLYVLQLDSVTPAQIAASDFDLVVMDPSADGSATGQFTSVEIASIRDSGKVVLAYLSIGEAEEGRWYWQRAWVDEGEDDPDRPPWLGPSNPEWPDDYKVRYWDPGWQALMLGTASGANESSLDRIIDVGFDGVYLDLVDAYQFWSEEQPERTPFQARTDMVAFVTAMRQYARQTRGAAQFLVFPQNAPEIITPDDFETVDAVGIQWLANVDGIGVEDVFFNEITPQPPDESEYTAEALSHYRAQNRRLVLVVDYVWDEADAASDVNIARYNSFESQCLSHHFVPYAASRNRDLDETLEIPAEGGIAEPQPKPDGTVPSGMTLVN